MADWFWPTLPSTGKPVTAEWGAAVQENPVAIAEGAPGAPRVVSKALGPLYLGQYDAPNTPVQLVNLDGSSVVRVDFFAASPFGALQVSSSTDGGATWGAWGAIAGGGTTGFSIIRLDTGAFSGLQTVLSTATASVVTGSILASSNAIRFRAATNAAGSGHAVFVSLGGS